MNELNFQVESAQADSGAAAPLLMLKLRIACADENQHVQNVALRCQVLIESTRRRYTATEQERLADLFGEPDRWSRTLGSLTWTHANLIVPPFEGQTVVDLPLPCTFDFNVAATKYFHGLEDGEIPLVLQFSGTVFYRDANDQLQIAQISWDKEARFRLPVTTWHEMMDHYYPNGAWLRLRRDVFDRLHRYKIENGIPDWNSALDSLLSAAAAQVTP